MTQMASLLAAATGCIGFRNPISTFYSQRRGGAYTRNQITDPKKEGGRAYA